MVHWPLMAQQGSHVTPHIQLEVCGRLQTNAFSGRQEGCQMLLRTSRPRSLQAELRLSEAIAYSTGYTFNADAAQHCSAVHTVTCSLI